VSYAERRRWVAVMFGFPLGELLWNLDWLLLGVALIGMLLGS
jgi:hypothetical protein